MLLTELQKKVDTFPAELDKAVKQTEKAITEKLESRYKYETQLADKEIEGERKLKEQIITTLESKDKGTGKSDKAAYFEKR